MHLFESFIISHLLNIYVCICTIMESEVNFFFYSQFYDFWEK